MITTVLHCSQRIPYDTLAHGNLRCYSPMAFIVCLCDTLPVVLRLLVSSSRWNRQSKIIGEWMVRVTNQPTEIMEAWDEGLVSSKRSLLSSLSVRENDTVAGIFSWSWHRKWCPMTMIPGQRQKLMWCEPKKHFSWHEEAEAKSSEQKDRVQWYRQASCSHYNSNIDNEREWLYTRTSEEEELKHWTKHT